MGSAKVIGFTGLKGSGKDTAARALLSQGWEKIAFADTLREVCKLVYGLTDEQMLNPNLKEITLEQFPFKSPRQILQTVGTEMFRNNIPGSWVNAWKLKTQAALYAGKSYGVVVTDFRFPDEADAIRSFGGTLIRIVRQGQVSTDLHESERYIPTLPVDFEITNNATSADAFIEAAFFRLRQEGLI